MLSVDYLRAILAGTKKLLKMSEVKSQEYIPHYPEINVKKLWEELKSLTSLNIYFPDICVSGSAVPDRTYFLTVD